MLRYFMRNFNKIKVMEFLCVGLTQFFNNILINGKRFIYRIAEILSI